MSRNVSRNVSDAFQQAATAVAEVLPRFTSLLRGHHDVRARAVGTWTLPDVACHVSHVIEKDTDALTCSPLPDVALSPASVAVWTDSMLAADPERDLDVLADRIDKLGERFLQLRTDPPRQATVPWVGGTPLPPPAIACHLLEELLVHGYDASHAARAKWPIDPAHAALAITGDAVPVIAASPQSWVRESYDPSVRARVEMRLRGHERFALALDNGLHVEMPPTERADVYLSADPAALLLVMLGRRSQWNALVRGQVFAWGRRPKALFTLLANVTPP